MERDASYMRELMEEWKETFSGTHYLATLKKTMLAGRLRETKIRSVCWKLCWGILPENRDEWASAMKKSRIEYEDAQTRFLKDPHEIADADLSINNPLSQAVDSPWQRFFQDGELRQVITQDVERTFPESDYFQSPRIRAIMMDVLFCYTKLHPELSYRQGMHELLAPIIQVLDCEKISSKDGDELMRLILSEDHVRHDSFALFSRLMVSTREWYTQGDDTRTPRTSVPQSPGIVSLGSVSSEDSSSPPAIVTKLRRIQHVLLREVDPELYQHLLKMEIEPQIYGLRWLRLLFGREFHLVDVLVLWDAIFADGSQFEIVDYICPAMLSYIRTHLIQGDYVTCLKRLMKYPPVEDVRIIIEKAQQIRQNQSQIARSASPVPSKGRTSAASGGSSTPPTPTQSLSSTNFANALGATTSTRPSPGTRRQSAGPQTAPRMKVQDLAKPVANFVSFIGSSFRSVGDSTAVPATAPATQSSTAPPAEKSNRVSVISTEGRETPPNARPSTPTRERVARQKSTASVAGAAEDAQRVRDLEAMNKACARRIQSHLRKLEQELAKMPDGGGEDGPDKRAMYLAIAGLKQTRDILYGDLPFHAAGDAADGEGTEDESPVKEASADGEGAGAAGRAISRSLFAGESAPGTQEAEASPSIGAAAIDPLGALLH
eukprot:Opistho-1_new@33724